MSVSVEKSASSLSMVAPLSFFWGLSEHASRKMRVNDSYALLSSEHVRILMLNVSIEINMDAQNRVIDQYKSSTKCFNCCQ